MDRFVYLTFDGLSRGAVYAAFALALVLIWRAARIVNFAQGAMAVAAVYVAYSVTDATGSYWLGFLAAIVFGLLLGIAVERVVMRFVDHSPEPSLERLDAERRAEARRSGGTPA
jgi:branched-chain amino acid transport system permease protein